MGETDAFGREKGEDPLAGLGWHSEQPADQPPPPTPAQRRSGGADSAPPPAHAAPPPEPNADPPPQRRERPRRTQPGAGPRPAGAVRALVLVALVFGGGALALAGLGTQAVDRAERFVQSLTTPAGPSSGAPAPAGQTGAAERTASSSTGRAPSEPRGVARGSLLRPFAFGKAVRTLRAGGYGRLTSMRVAPQRIDAILRTKSGGLRVVQIGPDGAARVLSSRGSGFSNVPTLSLAAIDGGAPDRLTRAAAKRLGKPTSHVSYLVYSQLGGAGRWTAFFRSGETFAGDARGRIARRIG